MGYARGVDHPQFVNRVAHEHESQPEERLGQQVQRPVSSSSYNKPGD